MIFNSFHFENYLESELHLILIALFRNNTSICSAQCIINSHINKIDQCLTISEGMIQASDDYMFNQNANSLITDNNSKKMSE